MKYKKIIMISILLLILSVTAVSAADFDSNYVTESSDVDGSLNSDDSFLGSSKIQDEDDSTGTFDDLQIEINNAPTGSVLNLTRDYNGAYGSRIQFNKDLTIDGQGHALDCLNTECTAFYSSSGNITLMNLIIINGHNDDNYNGGAIHIEGSAQYTIINCTLNNNWADDYGGAIYNGVDKPLTIINSSFNNNEADDYHGGAICSVGDVYLENSMFESNSANIYGGAIYCEKTVNMKKSIFKSNKVEGISLHEERGGAIHANEVNIINSTFENNYAEEHSGAINAKVININVNQSRNQSFNTFFINNEAENYAGGAISGIGVTANIFNAVFIGNKAGRGGGAIHIDNLNVTHCLFKSNVASRLSYESHGGAIYSTRLNIDNCTFEDNYADEYGGAVNAQYLNINVGQTPGEPYYSFFINNRADDDNGGAIRSYSGKVTAVNTIFSENSAEHLGGAIYSYGDVYTDNCLFRSNKIGGDAEQCYGGAIYAYENVHINNSTFENNRAEDYGGAIYADNIYINDNQNSSQTFNSFFINNRAGDNDGGALYSYYDLHVKNALFSGNSAYEDGGAIFCCDNAYITHCLFDSNKADGAISAQSEGGAIYCKDDLTVENSTFKNNYAYDYAGAIYADTLALRGYSYFDSNTAYDNHGGAIWVNKFREDVKYATFINNKAGEGSTDDGGAIYIDNENWLTFSQCVFVNNHCNGEGGAIYLDSSSSHLTLSNNIFVSNSAGKKGQAVYNYGKYDSINENWWGGKNPSSSNDELIEWKLISDDHHSDSNPLKFALKLSKDTCKVNTAISATAGFYKNDGSLSSGVMRTDYISFKPISDIEFYNRVDNKAYVDTLVSPQKVGQYTITANLFGQSASAVLSAVDGLQFSNNSPQNAPVNSNKVSVDGYYNVGFDSEYASVINNVNNGNTNPLDGINNVNNTNSTNKTPNNNTVTKTIDNNSNGGNFNYLWVLLAIVIVAGAVVLIRKYKN